MALKAEHLPVEDFERVNARFSKIKEAYNY